MTEPLHDSYVEAYRRHEDNCAICGGPLPAADRGSFKDPRSGEFRSMCGACAPAALALIAALKVEPESDSDESIPCPFTPSVTN